MELKQAKPATVEESRISAVYVPRLPFPYPRLQLVQIQPHTENTEDKD